MWSLNSAQVKMVYMYNQKYSKDNEEKNTGLLSDFEKKEEKNKQQ